MVCIQALYSLHFIVYSSYFGRRNRVLAAEIGGHFSFKTIKFAFNSEVLPSVKTIKKVAGHY